MSALRKRTSVPKVCECPKTRHEHGTYHCYASCGCSCDPCMEAARVYRAEQRRRRAEQGPRYVPIGPAQERLAELRRAGIGMRRLSELTGIPHRNLQVIRAGAREGTVQHTIQRETMQALMAFRPTSADVAALRQINATGTRRRLQALAALGWSRAELSRRSGLTPTTVGRLLSAEWCSIGSARTVHSLYESMWDQHPPEDAAGQRQSKARALANAARHGWAVPMAWDDSKIDDPQARPSGMPDGQVSVDQKLDDLVELVESGVPLNEAARRVGYQGGWDSACRVARRRGHPAGELNRRDMAVAA